MHEAERSNKEDYHRVRREQAAGHTERLSQSPCAIFESVFSGQGVTRTMSAHLINSICRVGSPCVIPVMDVEMQKFILKHCVLTNHSSSSVHTRSPVLTTSVRSQDASNSFVATTFTSTFWHYFCTCNVSTSSRRISSRLEEDLR